MLGVTLGANDYLERVCEEIRRLDRRQVWGEIDVQGDVLAQNAPEHFCNINDNPVEVHRLQDQLLFPAEGHQLPGQGAGPLARFRDFADRFSGAGVQLFIRHDEAGMTVDHREQIVEIMRDAAGQLTNGFHLLRLPQLSLKIGSFRHIHRQR